MKKNRDKIDLKGMPQDLNAFGYVVEEDGAFTAICINFGLFAQADSPDKAIKRVIKLIAEHYIFVLKHHSDEWEKYLYQALPEEYINEFAKGLNEMSEMTENERNYLHGRLTVSVERPTLRKTHIPTRTFVQEISPAYS